VAQVYTVLTQINGSNFCEADSHSSSPHIPHFMEQGGS